jgi:hypothetical protein
MAQRYIYILFLFNSFLCCLGAQGSVSKVIFVVDSATLEPLIGATIIVTDGSSDVTDKFGKCVIYYKEETDGIEVSYIGYRIKYTNVEQIYSSKILLRSGVDIEEIVISGNNIRTPNQTKVDLKEVKRLPTLSGIADPLRNLQLKAGVTTGLEGTTGLFVRGSSPDRNLILLDDAPIYNSAHFLGFISTFNASAIKDMTLYKGYMPGRYIGRSNAALDIRVKEGRKDSTSMSYTISPLLLEFNLEKPIVKDKTSLLVALRASPIDLLSMPLYVRFKNRSSSTYVGYQMYDGIIKLHHKISNNQFISYTHFNSLDRFRSFFSSETSDLVPGFNKFNYGNYSNNLKHYAAFKKSYINTSLTQSRYNVGVQTQGNFSDGAFANGNTQNTISHIGIRSEIETSVNRSVTLQNFAFVNFEYVNPSVIDYANFDGVFLERIDLWGDNPKHYVSTGISNGAKVNLGSMSMQGALSTWVYSIREYQRLFLEPRIELQYKLPIKSVITLSYNKLNQPLQFLASRGLSLPTDFWMPSTRSLPATGSNSYSVGYLHKPLKNISFQVEAYYNTTTNEVALRDGIDYFDQRFTIQQKLASNGRGELYGIETSLSIKLLKLDASINYTYARSFRTFDDINGGKTFPFKYDRPHLMNITTSYEMSKKWLVSSVFQLASGINYTLPERYHFLPFDNNSSPIFRPILFFESRNNARFNAYTRLDLGIKRIYKKSELGFGIYNALGNINPIYHEVFYQSYGGTNYKITNRANGFLTFFPYVSYSKKIK